MNRLTLMAVLVLAASLSSCNHRRDPSSRLYDPNDPGYEYNPETDMYYAVGYESFTQFDYNTNYLNRDSINLRRPAMGSVPMDGGRFYYPFPNTPEGYEAAASYRDTVRRNASDMAEGKRLYETFCWHCHGINGEGDGPVAAFHHPPSYKSDRFINYPDGKAYHVIYHGRNLMGPHRQLINPAQRWQIIHYIKTLMVGAGSAAPEGNEPATDSTSANPQ